ncbi:MAG: CRISPR-associated endonuclease Cas1 [Candidatus Aminicenantia bacterium]
MAFFYGYGILYSTVWGSLVNAGLEPFAGFLHVDRPGKPSLVLDLIGEFRQPVIDRVVIAHVYLGQDIKITDGLLDAYTKKIIGEKILGKLESVETYKGKKYQIRSIIQMQARNLASFFNKSGCSLIPNEERTMRRVEVQKSVRKKAIGVKRKGIF